MGAFAQTADVLRDPELPSIGGFLYIVDLTDPSHPQSSPLAVLH